MATLVIIPCGQAKIWDKQPEAGAVQAQYAYTGAPFKVNKEYAEYFGDRWVILSAKYGFIDPDFMIPEPYNISFKKKSSEPVSVDTLVSQIKEMGLNIYEQVVGLGGKEYRAMIVAAFVTYQIKPEFPFAGLPIGKTMAKTKESIRDDSK
jgi:hypothetical protein